MIQTKGIEELRELEELKYKHAFIMNNPITDSTQMLKDIEFEDYEADEEVEFLVKEHKAQAILNGTNEDFIELLEKKLCSFGGELLCYDRDEYSELIFENGQLWYGEDIYLKEMEKSKCHSNTVKINDEFPQCPIVVGYALSEYGYWFSHTWALVPDIEDNRNYVFETTYPASLYYGVVLTKEQTEYFKENYII